MARKRAPTLETLRDEAIHLIQEYASLERGRTEVLRRLAENTVEVRSRFITDEGIPDWAGRSYEYRQHMHEVYEGAGVPADSQSNIQAALRYHVGNLLRERVSPEELEQSGLLTVSPKERIAAQRADLVAAAEAMGVETSQGNRRQVKAAALIDAAERSLDALERRLEALGPDEASEVVERLQRLQSRLESVLGAAMLQAAIEVPKRRRARSAA